MSEHWPRTTEYGQSDDENDSVVTVHGIRDDYNIAWTDNAGIWWVRKQLFKDLSTRQLDYSYEIDEESTLYDPNGIRLHAETLITRLAEIRRELEDVGSKYSAGKSDTIDNSID